MASSSLAGRLNGLVVGVGALSLLAFAFGSYFISTRYFDKEFSSLAIASARSFAEKVESYKDWQKNPELVEALVNNHLWEEPNIIQIDVVAQGVTPRLIYSNIQNATEPPESLRNLEPKDVIIRPADGEHRGRREIIAPILFGKRIVGYVSIVRDIQFSRLITRRMVPLLLGTTAMILLFGLIIVRVFIRQNVEIPLDGVLGSLKSASRGNYQPLDPKQLMKTPWEIGKLIENINELFVKLSVKDVENKNLVTQLSERGKNLQIEVLKSAEKLVQLQRELLQREKLSALGQMGAELAHEVGTPLNAVQVHLQLLKEESSDKSPRIDVALEQLERIAQVIQRYLDRTRGWVSARGESKLKDALARVLELTSPQRERKGIRVEVDVPEDIMVPLVGIELEQVLINLISNSMDACKTGDVISIGAYLQNGKVSIEIEDTGSGIAPEVIAEVKRPFFSTKEKGVGTGLGLAICEEVVRRANGELTLSSEFGHGTQVKILFPKGWAA